MKKILIRFSQLIQNLCWGIELYQIRKQIVIHKYPNLCLSADDRILIIVPHADDEWISCSTLIRKHKDAVILYMNMDGGDDDITHQEREKELRNIAKTYNANLFVTNGDKVKELIYYLNIYKPSYVFIPFLFDWHEEHIQCMKFLKQALLVYRKKLNIAMYQVSLPIAGANMITNISPMTKHEWDSKWSTFTRVYKTQNMIPYKRFAIYEKILTLPAGYYAAEVYSVQSSNHWINNIDDWILTDEEKMIAKYSLNNLIKTFDLITGFKKRRVWKI